MSKFELGQTVMTRGVADALSENPDFMGFVIESLERYKGCDWGEMADEDKALNVAAVKNGDDRILAAYKNSVPKAWKIWIITEWDRSYTTILFPDEY